MTFSSELFASIENNNLEEFKSLLAAENQLDINAQSTSINIFYSTGKRHSLLHVAIKANAIDIVKFLLVEKKANPDEKDGYGDTPLITAVYNSTVDQTDIVESLLNSGANPNQRGRKHPFDTSPLWYAANWRKINTVKMLLARGADPSVRGPDHGNSAWHVAYEHGHHILSDLLKSLVSDEKKTGENHLHYLLNNGYALEELPFILKNSYKKLLQALIAHAATNNRTDILTSIINTFIHDKNHINNFYLALENNDKLMQKICLCLKEDSTASPIDKLAIIVKLENAAVGKNCKKQLEQLKGEIQNAAKVVSFIASHSVIANKLNRLQNDEKIKDKKNASNLQFSQGLTFDTKVVTYAKLLDAVNKHNFDAVAQIINDNPHLNLNIRDKNGTTLLEIAYIKKRNFDTVIYSDPSQFEALSEQIEENKKILLLLLDRLDVNARSVNSQTLLHTAVVEEKSISDVILFLLKGADPNLKDSRGKRPIDYIQLNEKGECVNLAMKDCITLLEKGADCLFNPALQSEIKDYGFDTIGDQVKNAYLNRKDKNGDSAIHRAIKNKDNILTDALLDKKVDFNIQDKNGNTPLHLAILNNDVDLVCKILEKEINLDFKNNTDATALTLAITMKVNTGIIEALLKKGADPNIGRKMKSDAQSLPLLPFTLAVGSGQWEVARILIRNGAYPSSGLLYSDNNTEGETMHQLEVKLNPFLGSQGTGEF